MASLYDIENEKKEIPDNFADQFSVTMHPYGVTFSWMKTRVVPMGTVIPEGQGIPPEIVQITRMAPAHVKMMVFTIYRLIREREKEQDCIIPIPKQTLDDMKIEVTDWAAFWGEIKDEATPEVVPIAPVATVAPVEAAPAIAGSQPNPA